MINWAKSSSRVAKG